MGSGRIGLSICRGEFWGNRGGRGGFKVGARGSRARGVSDGRAGLSAGRTSGPTANILWDSTRPVQPERSEDGP